MKATTTLCLCVFFLAACEAPYFDTVGEVDSSTDIETDSDVVSDTSSEVPEDVVPDTEPDTPLEELCSDGFDNEPGGVAGLADCRDTDVCCGTDVCADSPFCGSEDASEEADAPEDVVEDTDLDPAVDPDPDPDPDVVSDPDVDPDPDPDPDPEVEIDVPCTPTAGEVTLTWTLSGMAYDELRAECWVRGYTTSGTPVTLDSWHTDWDTISGTADAVATSAFSVSHTLTYAPGAEAWCNFVAFNWGGVMAYAIGSYSSSSGTYHTAGTLTAESGTCDVTSDVGTDPDPPGPTDTGPSINYYYLFP